MTTLDQFGNSSIIPNSCLVHTVPVGPDEKGSSGKQIVTFITVRGYSLYVVSRLSAG